VRVPPVSVDYNNVRQENEYWCWAAVTSNVYNSFKPKKNLSQCALAQLVFQSCSSPGGFVLRNALSAISIWEAESDQTSGFFGVVSDELSGVPGGVAEPVCAEASFGSGGTAITHFTVITGFDPDTHNVWVADPFTGGDSVEFVFEDFLKRYYFTDPGGTVQQSGGVIKALQSVLNIFK